LLASAFQLASIPSSISAAHGVLHAPLELHHLICLFYAIFTITFEQMHKLHYVSTTNDSSYEDISEEYLSAKLIW